MSFFVYLLITKQKNKLISYVGYTSNLQKRLKLHNTSKGAKFTKGRKWKLAYSKRYKTKSLAMIVFCIDCASTAILPKASGSMDEETIMSDM